MAFGMVFTKPARGRPLDIWWHVWVSFLDVVAFILILHVRKFGCGVVLFALCASICFHCLLDSGEWWQLKPTRKNSSLVGWLDWTEMALANFRSDRPVGNRTKWTIGGRPQYKAEIIVLFYSHDYECKTMQVSPGSCLAIIKCTLLKSFHTPIRLEQL